MSYIPRLLETQILEYLTFFPTVSLTGPRQSGKSTLLRQLLPNYRYITFDDATHIEHFEQDPKSFIQIYDNHVIFDEAQKCPQLFDYVKIAVDNDRKSKGKYVLSGSSQFTLLEQITESLAGRIGLLTLLPLQYAEITETLRQQSMLSGCYPELVTQQFQKSSAWYGAYLSTYIERDVRNISNIGDLRVFRNFVSLLAANVAQQLNMSTYANDLGVSVPTIKRWLSILETSYVIYLLPPHFKNVGKRVTKAPKIYFYDTGLVNYLVGINDENYLHQGPMAGQIFENYLVIDVLKQQYNYDTHNKLYYLRTNGREEVDLIIDHRNTMEFIEIKKNSTFRPKMASSLKSFITEHEKGVLVYTGEDSQYNSQISVLNYNSFLLRKPS